MKLQPETRLGRYQIIVPLGKGGMGEVWQACIAARLGELERAVSLLREALASGSSAPAVVASS